jgi:hypothetical protein
MVDDPIVIQAFSAGSTIATTTETKTLNWGLPLSGGDD